MFCCNCNRFVSVNRYCTKWKTNIKNPYSDTDCKFFVAKGSKTNPRPKSKRHPRKMPPSSVRPGCERRSKNNYELVGGLVYVQTPTSKKTKK